MDTRVNIESLVKRLIYPDCCTPCVYARTQAVQQVVANLQIGQIELRSEDSFDIQQYVHQKKVELMVVPLDGEILEVKTAFLRVQSFA